MNFLLPLFLTTFLSLSLLNQGFAQNNNPSQATDSEQSAFPEIVIDLVRDDLSLPTYALNANDGSDRLFIVQLDGFIKIIEKGELLEAPFLNLDGIVTARAGEQGMYGMAFHPNYKRNRRFFISYTEHPTGDLVIAEHRTSLVNRNYAYRSLYRKELLRFSPAEPFHHGGQLNFGPDGYLYISVGDGGGPLATKVDGFDNALAFDSFAGKILRIDIDNGDPYAVPEDNPFVALPWVKSEIYAMGFRNPWKFSFDTKTGEIITGDVGNYDWEEINIIESGGNYGWPAREGPVCFLFPDTLEIAVENCEADRYLDPLFIYGHAAFDSEGGNAIVGGYVYRGKDYPELEGLYFYSDFTNGRVWALRRNKVGVESQLVFEINRPVTSFAQDNNGELYILTITGTLHRIKAKLEP